MRRKFKGDYMKVRESKARKSFYRIVNKIMCPFEGGYTSEGSEEGKQKQWTGLA